MARQATLNELAEKYQIAPAALGSWNKQFQEHAADVFRREPADSERQLEEKEQEISVLQQKVGQLTIERDWLNGELTKSLAPTVRITLVSPGNESLIAKRQCELAEVNRSSVYRVHSSVILPFVATTSREPLRETGGLPNCP